LCSRYIENLKITRFSKNYSDSVYYEFLLIRYYKYLWLLFFTDNYSKTIIMLSQSEFPEWMFWLSHEIVVYFQLLKSLDYLFEKRQLFQQKLISYYFFMENIRNFNRLKYWKLRQSNYFRIFCFAQIRNCFWRRLFSWNACKIHFYGRI
jgi:hypothetical protein